MLDERPSSSDRFAVEREHEERALADRLRRAARRPPAENLAAALELIRTAQDFRAAFADAARR